MMNLATDVSLVDALSEGLDAGLRSGTWLSAIVLALITVSGWIYNRRQDRLVERRNKNERRDDFHKAVYAEIRSYVHLLEHNNTAHYGEKMAKRIREERDFVPFIPEENHSRFYEAIQSEIHVLPTETVGDIIAFYTTLGAIDAMIDDMRSEAFTKISPERRALIYEDYIGTKLTAEKLGRKSLELIELYVVGGRQAIRDLQASRKAQETEKKKQEVKNWIAENQP